MGYDRVCAWTAYGRKPTASILFRYLAREHAAGVLDEWLLCMNTPPGRDDDIAYAQELAAEHDWIHLRHADRKPVDGRYNPCIYQFYAQLTRPDTVYLHFNDDIVYIHPETLPRLIAASERDGILAAFPVIINNAAVSWHLQREGKIPGDAGTVGEPTAMDPTGWADPGFAEALHGYVLGKLESGDAASLFLDHPVTLPPDVRFSDNANALPGERLAPYAHTAWGDGEEWLTQELPGKTGKRNMIVNDALVCHYSFFTQYDHMQKTPVLGRYRALAP